MVKDDRDSEVLQYQPRFKWAESFMAREASLRTLPFLLVYRANGVMKSGHTKSAAIAIATKKLQEEGILAPESNTLSLYGHLAQRKKLEELGERTVKGIIKAFDS